MSLERHPREGGDPVIGEASDSKSEFMPCFVGCLCPVVEGTYFPPAREWPKEITEFHT
jgi:hypothetical protein